MSSANEIKKWNRRLRLLGFFKIPMIWYVKPRVIRISEEVCEVKIRLRRRTRNHLGSMYFGALAIGADTAPGLLTFFLADKIKMKISFAFKSVHGEFIRRPEGDVSFICDSHEVVKKALNDAHKTGERVNVAVPVECYTADKDHVASFVMTLSVKPSPPKVAR